MTRAVWAATMLQEVKAVLTMVQLRRADMVARVALADRALPVWVTRVVMAHLRDREVVRAVTALHRVAMAPTMDLLRATMVLQVVVAHREDTDRRVAMAADSKAMVPA